MTDNSFIIVDLEATCWEKGTSPARMETIEIGAVRIGGSGLCTRGEFGRFVRPVSEPLLSDFCTQLTGISQDDVDGAEPFPVVFKEFLDWAGAEPFVWCSWGAYDLRQSKTDCARHDLQWPPVLDRHLNLKAAFAQQMGCRTLGMKGALQKLGIPLAGMHHRAIDDARNIARIGAVLLPALCPQPAARTVRNLRSSCLSTPTMHALFIRSPCPAIVNRINHLCRNLSYHTKEPAATGGWLRCASNPAARRSSSPGPS